MCKKGEFAAFILYFTNGITFLLAIAGLALGVWLVVAESAVSNSVPDYLTIAIIVISIIIAFVAGLGIFATVAQMKENSDKDPNTGAALGKEGCCTKDCCNSCGLSLYSFLSIIGAFLALAMGIVAVYYAGALPDELENQAINATLSSWFSSLSNFLDDKIYALIDRSVSNDGNDWTQTQDLLGCCGWNSTEPDPDVLTGACCTNSTGGNVTLLNSLSGETLTKLFDGTLTVTLSTCNAVEEAVLTCKGLVLYQTKANLLSVGIVLIVIFGVLLVCFICALKVRYCSGGQGFQGAVVAPGDAGKKNAASVKPSSESGASKQAHHPPKSDVV
jgi:hypothetical protein